jgi:NAD(P)-dependent dehydrogenase (short-subunit alcohol dehydrogenase family)
MAGRLKDKVCIITGTGSGMGRAAALLFCAEGAKVVGCDINAESAEATLREALKAGGQMVSLQPADLTQQTQCDALAALALKSYGGIDVVYNNAATAYFGWMDQFTFEEFARTIDEELLIVFRFCKTVWPHLVPRGGGSIINVASTSAKVAYKALPGICPHGRQRRRSRHDAAARHGGRQAQNPRQYHFAGPH